MLKCSPQLQYLTSHLEHNWKNLRYRQKKQLKLSGNKDLIINFKLILLRHRKASGKFKSKSKIGTLFQN